MSSEQSNEASADSKAGKHSRPAPARLDADGEGNLNFIRALRTAGLLAELSVEELRQVSDGAGASAQSASGGGDSKNERSLDLLRHYYTAGGDEAAAERRSGTDCFFMHCDGEPWTAIDLVERLAGVLPGGAGLRLERVGGVGGPLVLHWQGHRSVVDDDEDEDAEDQDAEDEDDLEVDTLTVFSLVRALNNLLRAAEFERRLVQLRSDADREVYVATQRQAALELCDSGHLEYRDRDELLVFAAW